MRAVQGKMSTDWSHHSVIPFHHGSAVLWNCGGREARNSAAAPFLCTHTHIHMHTVPRAARRAREMSMLWKTRLTVVITPSDCYT